MRVLHVQKVTGIGGSERHLLSLLPGLAACDVQVRMCVLAEGSSSEFVGPLRDQGVEVEVVPSGPNLNPLLIRRLVTRIHGYQPDLVHTHLIHADLHGQMASWLAGVPGLSSVHSTNWFYRRQPFRTAARLAGGRAARTIAISHHVSRFLRQWHIAPPESIRVIHYGIDGLGWDVQETERIACREELGIQKDDVIVGIASRLIPKKGHDWLLDAAGEAIRRALRMRLFIAGDGPLRARLEQQASTLPSGSVRFLGHVRDIRGFMGASDVLVFPSLPGLGEGFGLAALEGMAAGRPVVAARIDSLPEIVVDGETGILVPAGSVGDLTEALVRLCEDEGLRRRLGSRGRERAQAEFDLGRMVEQTVAVYRELL